MLRGKIYPRSKTAWSDMFMKNLNSVLWYFHLGGGGVFEVKKAYNISTTTNHNKNNNKHVRYPCVNTTIKYFDHKE